MTKIFDALKDFDSAIRNASELLRNGEVIAFPTETVYGLGAGIYNINAVNKVYELKGRSRKNPLSAHISELSHVGMLCESIPEDFYKLAEKFLPGPLAIVLPKKSTISDEVTANLNTISIRMPNHRICLELIQATGQPIAGTSANISGNAAATKPEYVLEDFDGKITAILSAGECQFKMESTVLSLADSEPTIYRQGAISQLDIEKLLGKKVLSANRNLILHSQNIQRKYRFVIHKLSNMNEILEKTRNSPEKRFLIFGNTDLVLNNYEIINLKQENYLEMLRYADKGNFDELLILADEILRNNVLLWSRIDNM